MMQLILPLGWISLHRIRQKSLFKKVFLKRVGVDPLFWVDQVYIKSKSLMLSWFFQATVLKFGLYLVKTCFQCLRHLVTLCHGPNVLASLQSRLLIALWICIFNDLTVHMLACTLCSSGRKPVHCIAIFIP